MLRLKAVVQWFGLRAVLMTSGAFLTSCVQIPPQDVIGGILPMQSEIVGGACDVARRETASASRHSDSEFYFSINKPLRLITWNIHKQKDTGSDGKGIY